MNLNINNIFLRTDSYKISHWPQYPAGTNKVYSYIESRGGSLDNTVFYGLQILIKHSPLNFFEPGTRLPTDGPSDLRHST